MRKIRKVLIKNFQSHKETKINFDDYVIIHGATNSGKSAIIRAIKWCLYNEAPPEGAELTRFGEKDTEVTLFFDDGRAISRKRSGKVNEYVLCDEFGTETSYTGFGRGPLKEVLDFHGMYMANLFGDIQSVNIVDQQEPPFFLSEGPTARGHLISRLAETLTYEAALIMLKKDAGELKRGIDVKRNVIDRLSSDIESISYIDDLESFLSLATTKSDIIEKNSNFINLSPARLSDIQGLANSYRQNFDIAGLLDNITTAQEQIQATESAKTAVMNIATRNSSLESVISNWRNHYKTYDGLRDVESAGDAVRNIDNRFAATIRINGLAKKLREIIEDYSVFRKNTSISSEIFASEELIASIESSLFTIKQIGVIWQKICELFRQHSELQAKNVLLDKEISDKTEEYRVLLAENGTCPICFSRVDKDKLIGVDI